MSNGDFSSGLAGWLTYATPDAGYLDAAVVNGVLEFYRLAPPPGTSNQGVAFQPTGLVVGQSASIRARFDVGNSSDVRKRITVLLHDSDFSDLSVCTFWLSPRVPLRTYEMSTHTTKSWANATVSFYAATEGSHGGAYLLDNVELFRDPNLPPTATKCVDPTSPIPTGEPNGSELLVNGDFSSGLTGWALYGQITQQVSLGVFEFYRPAGTPTGVIYQGTGQALAAGEQLTAWFDLGNSSTVRRRITVLLHDGDFSDLTACTFFLEPVQGMTTYAMRAFATEAWTNATLSVYPATVGTEQWYRLDNASLKQTSGQPVTGTECLESSGPIPPPPPAPEPDADATPTAELTALFGLAVSRPRQRPSEGR